MTRAGLLVVGALLAIASGCPAEPHPVPEPTSSPQPSHTALPGRPTTASTGLPAYTGPPANAPPSTGPLTTLRAAVDLTPATQGAFWRADEAVAAPDGGAYVVLSSEGPGRPQRLATVARTGDGFAVTGSVAVPRVDHVVGAHLLPDGTVAVAGRLSSSDLGLEVVDPRTGATRAVPLVPYERGTTSADLRTALSPDGRTLYLVATVTIGRRVSETLSAVDPLAGTVLAQRGLIDDVSLVSVYPMGRQLAGLVARPGGGATVVFDASPTEVAQLRIPTLLRYDASLTTLEEPVRVTSLAERAETQSVAVGIDGTVFLVVDVPDGAWILAVPDGGGAGPVLVQLTDRIFDYALTVEPAQQWALLPAIEGARAVDLRTGEIRGPLDVGCSLGPDVRAIAPAWQDAGALVVGQCDVGSRWVEMLWIAGP
ncbi:hypothetical protein [Petropleomorpha daqingensis]|uniref:Uncharacterized protein n=1 Tax=Petropleomorpha daqingensis TaxID=2026353 RepID=A0A853C9K1_9ACTN|nr:hypothetical protein [Petropleomorpha daqingensis]NYJ03831.1 hypothetical protein [Petropleomorpha daqingensis]